MTDIEAIGQNWRLAISRDDLEKVLTFAKVFGDDDVENAAIRVLVAMEWGADILKATRSGK